VLAGFVCPKSGKNMDFDYCFKKCNSRCHPLPTLLVLAERSRQPKKKIYHVTEICDPPKVIYLKRHNSYYRPPESLSYTMFGSAFHSIIEETMSRIKELGFENDYIFEEKNHFEVHIKTKHGKAILSGTPDLYIPKLEQLWDFKTAKYYYEVQDLLAGKWNESKHILQLNIYRVYKYPEAKELYLEMHIKDYQRRLAKEGVLPIMIIEVPILDDGYIKEYVKQAIECQLQLEKQKEPIQIRPCTKEETWNGIRCKDYCEGRDFCVQYLSTKKSKRRKK
jgi:hypothetical protein